MRCRSTVRVAFSVALSCFSSFASAATCYVNFAATGSNNGTSWANAYTDLQSALTNYPGCLEVWVARGTYKPTATTDRTISFNVKRLVSVYGGFAGTELSIGNRILAGNPTILSGDIGVAGNNSDNSYHVVLLDGSTASGPIKLSTLLADLTISGGNANGGGTNLNRGGGLYCFGQGADHECSPELTRLIFENNSATFGGAIYNDGNAGGTSSPNVHEVIVRNNQATFSGGGMYNNGGGGGTSNPFIDQVTFVDNFGGEGGAMYNFGVFGNSNPTVRNSTFYANTAYSGGAMYNLGGSSGHASPILRYVTFHKNKAGGKGGAIRNFASDGDAAPKLSGVIFWADEAANAPIEMSTDSLTTPSIEYSITPECPPAAAGCINADPLLSPLQDNGGFAPTLRPEIGSPAIDNGDAGKCPAIDERGIARPQGANCDIGAVELKPNERKVCYVNAAAGPTNTGLSWATAYVKLNNALADLTCSEVWVAQGTYVPTTLGTRTASFALRPGQAVYGGFAGNETTRGQRDAASHVTTLSGEIGSALSLQDNVYHVVLVDAAAAAVNVAGNTVLDGFTISGGYAEGTGLQRYGGGLLCDGQGFSCNPTLSNLTFSGNHAFRGGGLANYGTDGVASPAVKNVVFTNNEASNTGGAVLNVGTSGVSSPVLNSTTFVGNDAPEGGAMGSTAVSGISDPQVSGSTFAGNGAAFGGALYLYAAGGSYNEVDFVDNSAIGFGGAVYITDGSYNRRSSPAFALVRFVGNTSGNDGGAVYNNNVYGRVPTFKHATFTSNIGNPGGAVATYGGLYFSDVLFLRNGDPSSTQRGGAIAALGAEDSSVVVVDRAAFVDNAALALGGAVWTAAESDNGADVSTQITNATFWGNQAQSGSAVATRSDGGELTATVTLRSVTFAANTASLGNGTIYTDSINDGASSTTVRNAIIWGNSATVQVFNDPNSTTTIDHSFIQGGCQAYLACSTVLSVDPLLGNLQYNSGETPTLMPAANSPALYVGLNCPAVDQRGVARPQSGACDLGAVERRATEDNLFNNGFDF